MCVLVFKNVCTCVLHTICTSLAAKTNRKRKSTSKRKGAHSRKKITETKTHSTGGMKPTRVPHVFRDEIHPEETPGYVNSLFNSSEDSDDSTSDSTELPRWTRCKAPALQHEEEQRLNRFYQDNWPQTPRNAVLYVYLHRLAKHYKKLWVDDKRDEMHVKREKLAEEAIRIVQNQAPRPKDIPFGADKDETLDKLLPVLEHVFQMDG